MQSALDLQMLALFDTNLEPGAWTLLSGTYLRDIKGFIYPKIARIGLSN